MKTTKTLTALIAVTLFTFIGLSSVSAAINQGLNEWEQQNKEQNQEQNQALNEWEQENKEQNQEQNQALNEWEQQNKEQNQEQNKELNKAMETWAKTASWYTERVKNLEKRKVEVKEKLNSRYTLKVDWLMNSFEKRFENQSKEDTQNKYGELIWKIDWSLEKINNSTLSDAKKESYKNLFDYLKVIAEEKLLELEGEL